MLGLELSVLRKTISWVVARGGASMVLFRAVSAGPASCGPQIMLYVTLPLSFRSSSSQPLYSLRIGEFRQRPTTTQLVAKAPTLRELIDIQNRWSFGRSYGIGQAINLEYHARGVWPAI